MRPSIQRAGAACQGRSLTEQIKERGLIMPPHRFSFPLCSLISCLKKLPIKTLGPALGNGNKKKSWRRASVAPFLSFCRTGWQRTRQKRGPNDSLSCTSAATDGRRRYFASTMASVHGEEGGGGGGGERSEKCSRSGKRVKKMCARFQTTIETGGRRRRRKRRRRRRRLSEEQTTQSHARRAAE